MLDNALSIINDHFFVVKERAQWGSSLEFILTVLALFITCSPNWFDPFVQYGINFMLYFEGCWLCCWPWQRLGIVLKTRKK
jgi:hypothetical protein